jgi:hypothetical protein
MAIKLRQERQTANRRAARPKCSVLPALWRAAIPALPKTAKRAGRSQKVGIVTGVHSRAVRGELDQRFAFAKAVSEYTEEYRAHVTIA